jgi:hypothetical protein
MSGGSNKCSPQLGNTRLRVGESAGGHYVHRKESAKQPRRTTADQKRGLLRSASVRTQSFEREIVIDF